MWTIRRISSFFMANTIIILAIGVELYAMANILPRHCLGATVFHEITHNHEKTTQTLLRKACGFSNFLLVAKTFCAKMSSLELIFGINILLLHSCGVCWEPEP